MKRLLMCILMAVLLTGCGGVPKYIIEHGFDDVVESFDSAGDEYRKLSKKYKGEKVDINGNATKDSKDLGVLLRGIPLHFYSENWKFKRFLINESCPYGFEVEKASGKISQGIYVGKVEANQDCKLFFNRLKFISENGIAPEQYQKKKAKARSQPVYQHQYNSQLAEENWNLARPLLGKPEAIPYLTAAANEHHPAALYHLSKAYLNGTGVYRNYQQAEILMGDSAREKYPQAQYAFANMMYERARYARTQNDIFIFLPRAYAWYAVAERNGVRAATPGKNKTQRIMTEKKYGTDAEVNRYLWDEAIRLKEDGFSKYLIQ